MNVIDETVEFLKRDVESLTPVTGSKFHKAQEAAESGRLIVGEGDTYNGTGLSLVDTVPFVFAHDWLKIMEGAFDPWDVGNCFPLPFPACSFEFQVGPRRLILWTLQIEPGEAISMTALIEVGNDWVSPPYPGHEDYAVVQHCWDQVRAACVALDAGVAAHEEHAAPEKLNKKRARNGKPLIRSLMVVDLARKHKRASAKDSGVTSRKRLHFRRGHWRHLEESKTWVRWALVGDPSLGYVDHEYRL